MLAVTYSLRIVKSPVDREMGQDSPSERVHTQRTLISLMHDFITCQDCGFVLLGTGETAPTPKRWDSCPDCGGTTFQFTGN